MGQENVVTPLSILFDFQEKPTPQCRSVDVEEPPTEGPGKIRHSPFS